MMQNNVARFFLSAVILSSLLASPARSQQADEQKGIDQGNYNIKQSIEFGYRFTSIKGDQQTYDTLVNLQQGPRLLGFTTDISSLDHHGTMFDRLYFSNFGYGGDPNDVSQLRISKNKWYSFNGMFRKDQNLWDYSLLANPLNPTTPVPNAPLNFNPIINAPTNVLGTSLIGTSPHAFYTTRNMQNYGLTILPDSKIRFRLGYDQNTVYGPGYSTIHQGTEQYLLEDYSIHARQYRLGVDFRFLPRTTISYDEVWSYYKNDTGSTDANQQFSPGTGFPPVDLGVSWNPDASQPCKNTFGVGSIVNPTCSAYYNYLFHGRTRLNSPTEKVGLQSTYFKNIDLAGTFSYTGGDLSVNNYQQNFAGLESRTSLSNFAETGPIEGRHVATFADFGITWHITKDFSLVDSVNFSNWKQPGQFSSTDCSYYSNSLIIPANVFTPATPFPATCLPPVNGVPNAIPTHSASSAGDIALNLDSNFLKQQNITEMIQARVNISTKAGAYFGYKYRSRQIDDNFYNTQSGIYYPNNAARGNCTLLDPTLPLSQANLPQGCTLNPVDGSITYAIPGVVSPPGETDIQENHAIFGLWVRPTTKWRFTLDGDIMSANNTFTDLSPLTSQEVRIKANYKPAAWLTVNGNIGLWYAQNNVPNVNNLMHNNNYGFAVQIAPNEKWSVDLGYNYNDISSQILVCFVATGSEPGLPGCPNVPGLVQQLSPYTSKVNTGFVDFSWSPIRRLTLRGGANISSASGSELNLTPENPIATSVAGPLNSSWYQPFGGFDVRFTKNWTGHAMWDYYGYHENATTAYQDLLAQRNFQGNLVMLSVRYAF
jgi:opacity protein-like surface antigen